MHVLPASPPAELVEAWHAALDDAGIDIDDTALIWRPGRPRPTGMQAASWRPNSKIKPEFDDDHDLIEMLRWANRDDIKPLRRILVWTERTTEGLAGLLRHELEHTIQIAYDVELDHLHERADEELRERAASGKAYNAVPMEVDANRAAARFLRTRFGAGRIQELVDSNDPDSSCFRPTEPPGPLDTLNERMGTFILNVMHDDDFVARLEAAPTAT